MTQFQENIDLRYSEVASPDAIAHVAECFFEFSVGSDCRTPISHEVFPDGCVSLLYRRNHRLGTDVLLLKGLSLEPFYTGVFAGDIHWGVRFLPGAASKILRTDPKDIPTQPVNGRVLPHLTSGLIDRLQVCRDFSDARRVFSEMLVRLAIDPLQTDRQVALAVKLISKSDGESRISEIADSVGLGRRQLERRFRQCTGMTPKQFSRVRRFRATAENLVESNVKWADCAAEMGFADQSHLSREIFSLTNHSPKSFERTVKRIEFGGLVRSSEVADVEAPEASSNSKGTD
jgi:AraC-like DNA-binding protein